MTNRGIITIIGKEQARTNFKFIFHGHSNDCKVCKYNKACLSKLEAGRIYVIIRTTKKDLECKLHGGKGRVVEVIEETVEGVVDARMAIQDVLIEFNPIGCNRLTCKNYKKCVPSGLIDGDKCKVIKIIGTMDCPKGLSLVSVSFQRQA